MLQGANTYHFNPLVPKLTIVSDKIFPLKIKTVKKSVKATVGRFIFFDLRHQWVKER